MTEPQQAQQPEEGPDVDAAIRDLADADWDSPLAGSFSEQRDESDQVAPLPEDTVTE